MGTRVASDFASMSPEEREASRAQLTSERAQVEADFEENDAARVALDADIDAKRAQLAELNVENRVLADERHRLVSEIAALEHLERAEKGATASSGIAEGLPLPVAGSALS